MKNLWLVSAFVLALPAVHWSAPELAAQTIDVRGYASVNFGGDRCLNGASPRRSECQRPTQADVESALEQAILQGIDAYAASRGNAESSLWQRVKSQLGGGAGNFILDRQILSEVVEERGGVLSISARALVDWNGIVSMAARGNQSGDFIGVVLLVRSESEVTSFLAESRAYAVTTVEVGSASSAQASSQVAVSGTEARGQAVDSVARIREDTRITGGSVILGDSVQRNSTALATLDLNQAVSASAQAQGSSRTEERVEVASGGSVVRRRDQVLWDVGTSEAVNAVVSGTLADARFEPVEAAFFEDDQRPALMQTISSEFASGEELSGATLRRLVAAAQAVDLPYVLLGTVDLGLGEPDPISGATRAVAVVTARVYDVRGRLPRTVLAVGPESHAGLGSNHSVALNNAIEQAAQAVAYATVVRLVESNP
jgi:hypothetical protein